MVANLPWQKAGTRPITPAADRLAMVTAAVADVPRLIAGDHEIRAGGPSYTADTLQRLADEYPGGDAVHDRRRRRCRRPRHVGSASTRCWRRLGSSSSTDLAIGLCSTIMWECCRSTGSVSRCHDSRSRAPIFASVALDGRPLDYLVTDRGARRDPGAIAVRDRASRRDRQRSDVAAAARQMALAATFVALVVAGALAVAGVRTLADSTAGRRAAETRRATDAAAAVHADSVGRRGRRRRPADERGGDGRRARRDGRDDCAVGGECRLQLGLHRQPAAAQRGARGGRCRSRLRFAVENLTGVSFDVVELVRSGAVRPHHRSARRPVGRDADDALRRLVRRIVDRRGTGAVRRRPRVGR